MPVEPNRQAPLTAEQRIYHRLPTRVSWLKKSTANGNTWARRLCEQTIHADTHETSGVFEVTMIYEPGTPGAFQVDSPKGKSYTKLGHSFLSQAARLTTLIMIKQDMVPRITNRLFRPLKQASYFDYRTEILFQKDSRDINEEDRTNLLKNVLRHRKMGL